MRTAIPQFAMAANNLHLVASLVEAHIRRENDLLTEEVQKLDRRLRLHQNMYRILGNSHDQLSSNYMMIRRVLREIFAEDPELRMAYRPVVYFSDLETDEESEDEEGHVQRRLSFSDEELEIIDLTEDDL